MKAKKPKKNIKKTVAENKIRRVIYPSIFAWVDDKDVVHMKVEFTI